MLYGTVAALAALLLTAVLARLLRALGLPAGLVDRPGGRKAHPRPTPHLGGAAVVAGVCAISATGYAPIGPGVMALLWAAGAVALIGFVDDVRPLGMVPRLAVETGAALYVVQGSGLSPAAATLAVGWIVFVTNAFNLLDTSDGAVGTVGAVTAIGLSFCAAAEGRAGLALLLVVLAAALVGFLTLNWHPARIFLGDCGALFTGFVLASAAVLVHTGRAALPSAAALFALTAVVTADTGLVLLSRRRAGRPLLRGGTDHVAHRLRRVGFTVPGAAVVLGAVALAGAVLGVLVHRGAAGPAAVLPLAGVVLLAVWGLLRVPVYGRRVRAAGAHGASAGAHGASAGAHGASRGVGAQGSRKGVGTQGSRKGAGAQASRERVGTQASRRGVGTQASRKGVGAQAWRKGVGAGVVARKAAAPPGAADRKKGRGSAAASAPASGSASALASASASAPASSSASAPASAPAQRGWRTVIAARTRRTVVAARRGHPAEPEPARGHSADLARG